MKERTSTKINEEYQYVTAYLEEKGYLYHDELTEEGLELVTGGSGEVSYLMGLAVSLGGIFAIGGLAGLAVLAAGVGIMSLSTVYMAYRLLRR